MPTKQELLSGEDDNGRKYMNFASFLRHLRDDDMMAWLKNTTREHGDFFPMYMQKERTFMDWFQSGFHYTRFPDHKIWEDMLIFYMNRYGYVNN